MKITRRELRKIITGSYSRFISESKNILIDDDGYLTYLLSPRFITSDMMRRGDPDLLAEMIKQSLRGDLDPQIGFDAIFELYPMVQDGHPLISKNPNSANDIMDFLDYAIEILGDMGAR